MSFERDLCAFLLTVSALTDVLGSSPMRVRPGIAKQGETTPYVTFQSISKNDLGRVHLRTDGGKGPSGVAKYRVQFDFFSESHDAVVALAALFDDALLSASGSFGENTLGGVEEGGTRFLEHDAERELFRQVVDYLFQYHT